MATTNLVEQSLGDMFLQHGNGTPDHTAPKGSLYSNLNTGIRYINMIGTNVWSDLVLAAYGELYLSSTLVVSPSTNGYTALTTNMILRNNSGISLSSGSMSINTGYSGTYGMLLSMTLSRNAVSTTYTGGISIDSAAPTLGFTGGTSVDATRLTSNLSVYGTVVLTPGTTITTALQAGVAGNVNVLYNNLILWRKGI